MVSGVCGVRRLGWGVRRCIGIGRSSASGGESACVRRVISWIIVRG